MRYPHHPFGGKRISVIHRLTYDDRLHFLVEGPDNGRLLLPARMTETAARVFPTAAVPRPPIGRTLELFVASLTLNRQPHGLKRFEPVKGDDEAISTMAATQSASHETPGNFANPPFTS